MRYLQLYIYLLTVCILSNFKCVANADSLEILRKADSLSLAGEHYLSSVFYRKALYFEVDQLTRCRLALKGASELKLVQKYNDAAEVLNSVQLEGMPDSVVFLVKYQCALLSYLDGSFGAAENYLLQIRYLIKDTARFNGTYLLNALILNEQFKWKEAQKKLLALNESLYDSDSLELPGKKMIDELYEPSRLPRIKNKDKAVRMSTFLPGLGQAYAGYPGEGAVNLSALLITSGAMVFGILNQYYFTSIVLGNVVIGKFYQGGLSRTEFLVDKKNYQRTRKFNEDIKNRVVPRFSQ
jgi:hypothetical protein